MREKRWLACVILGTVAVMSSAAVAAQVPAAQKTAPSAAVAGDAAGAQAVTQQGVELDRLVAVVNGDVILESDVQEEMRLGAFQPFRDAAGNFSREQAIDRLVDRTLILQQGRLQQEEAISDPEVEEQLNVLRKDIPACKEYRCETDAGWQKFVADHGFTMSELVQLWRQRMEVLQFIETRFRTGIHISDDEIKDYYQKTLLPQYESQKAVAPKMETISDRIQEILLQQQVGNMLGDWLKSLRAQGTVRMIQDGGGMP
jgi:peptidyl-prolyl cis-trans isomerase SurA